MQNEPHDVADDADNEPQDVAALVAGLTEAQRRAIMALDGIWRPVPATVSRQSVAALANRKSHLCEMGWPRGRFTSADVVEYRLTPLGQRVADHLRTGASHGE